MFRPFACRLLTTFVLALTLVGCGALERKPERKLEPTLASAIEGNAPAGAGVEAAPAARPVSSGPSTESAQLPVLQLLIHNNLKEITVQRMRYTYPQPHL